ncbi:MAG: hypothetical protein LQ343_006446 [Gyalolechia ehrenbergii]|nr:MAG: hypothetical protein LQ343_006446 [Gyalolechia ehrenbergii]
MERRFRSIEAKLDHLATKVQKEAETKSNPYSEMMNHLKELETCTLKLVDAVEALGAKSDNLLKALDRPFSPIENHEETQERNKTTAEASPERDSLPNFLKEQS